MGGALNAENWKIQPATVFHRSVLAPEAHYWKAKVKVGDSVEVTLSPRS